MISVRSSYRGRRLKKRRKFRMLLLCLLMVTALTGLAWEIFYTSPSTLVNAGLSEACVVEVRSASGSGQPPTIPEPDHVFSWTIAAGDTLSSIFDSHGISRGDMYQVLSADESLLALDILRPGHQITLAMDPETRALASMELFINPGNRILYNRVDETSFDYDEVIIPGEWRQELLDGDITSSFYVSARSAGLTEQETGNVTELFRDQIMFSRDMRSGDRFQVIRSRQFVEGAFTGQSRIEGVRIYQGRRVHNAFLFEDGRYYDHDGKSLARAFRRYPTTGTHRISSHFSRSRRHPVTGRVAPHNGVDFAMPTGTPVLSIGDGVVTRVHNHPFAGKYVEIQHGSHYASRYLHLSRTLVRRGQTVKRGERVALSGNTGRSTGPHLHFELHVRGRPVNPLTASIPIASSIPGEKLDEFNRHVGELVAWMEEPSRKIALHRSEDHG